ncbi:MAG TPA: hypothetical protein VHK69_15495 [Chitinophagaceae bacterium]|jgi:hypothetical protein|nr:hypothetical protein [Chitinophagaceae bacterium]
MNRTVLCRFLPLLVLLFSCAKEKASSPEPVLYRASGNIGPVVEAFRADLGPLNTTPGATSGRREVNWDGVPDSLLDQPLPGDFFNPVGAQAVARQRGLVYASGGFRASASGFASVNGQAAPEFVPFSGSRLFANVSSAAWPVNFRVAGTHTVASVRAFGLVFADVDAEGSVTVEPFEGPVSLGRYTVPARSAGSPFSFFGIRFPDRRITEVLVRHEGKLIDGMKDISQGGPEDLVAVDDFIYSEPVAE